MIHDYKIFVFENGWEYIGTGSADLKTVYPSLQHIAKHLNYRGLMMLQQTYVDKKIYFVV